jgi:hypothetical protein
VVSEAQKKSENAVAAAQAQAKKMLDEATARATAIHDGAERRLNLLVARHTETVRRLTEVRDVVTNLVAGEAARGSLEEEVARSVASAVSGGGTGNGTPAAAPRQAPLAEGRHVPAPAARPAPANGGTAQAPAGAAQAPAGAGPARSTSHRGSPVPGEQAAATGRADEPARPSVKPVRTPTSTARPATEPDRTAE